MNSIEVKQLRDNYIKLSKDELTDFDKNFFYVTAGIFAFSVTFIKDIVNIEFALWVIFLLISWILTALSIGFIMVSFYYSSYSNQKVAKFLGSWVSEEGKINMPSSRPIRISKKTESSLNDLISNNIEVGYFLRLASIFSFLLGLFFLLLFLIINFYFSNKPKDKISNLLPSKESTIVPSKNNPVNPSLQKTKNDSTFRVIESSTTSTSSNSIRIDSTILVIKPDTIYLKMQNNFYSPKKIKHVKKRKRC